MYSVQCTVNYVRCKVNSVKLTVYSVQCSVYSVQCTVYSFSVQCTVHSVQCTVYNVQSRVWWETVKRQRDLVHLQAGKKASSKRSDSRCYLLPLCITCIPNMEARMQAHLTSSSEEVEVVRKGEKEEQWNTQSNGTQVTISHIKLLI